MANYLSIEVSNFKIGALLLQDKGITEKIHLYKINTLLTALRI